MSEEADPKSPADPSALGSPTSGRANGESVQLGSQAAGSSSDRDGQEEGRETPEPPLAGRAQRRPRNEQDTAEALDARRAIPAVGRILNRPAVASLVQLYGREAVAIQLRPLLADLRTYPAPGREGMEGPEPRGEALESRLEQDLRAGLEAGLGGGLRRVINATGIILHTNLGRAPLPRGLAASLAPFLDASCDLELDLETGSRGQRNRRADALLCALTGAPAGLVVNNNAAALVLALHTLASGREVVVSRGELVEIGGSFRVPAILEAAGTRLVEVGTTNRTRLGDFRAALGPQTGLILKVHPSNYRMTGFVEETSTGELATLAAEAGVPLLVDEGAGMLRPSRRAELQSHESMQEHLAAGADLVCGSGDKLLGGPQAGLLVGGQELIHALHRNPLYRALRPDRAALAALEAVLRVHLAGGTLPIDGLWPDPKVHRERLERFAAGLQASGVPSELVAAEAFVGGGAAPEVPIPGEALAVVGSDGLARRLRVGTTPVMCYQRAGRLILDLRTVDLSDDETVVAAVVAAHAEAADE